MAKHRTRSVLAAGTVRVSFRCLFIPDFETLPQFYLTNGKGLGLGQD